jgi:hypothetical protein
MYLLSWRALQRMRRRLIARVPSENHDQMLVFGRMLQVALVGNTVSGFFLSMAYSVTLWVLFAVIIACVSLVAPASVSQHQHPKEPPDRQIPVKSSRKIRNQAAGSDLAIKRRKKPPGPR